MKKLFYAVYLLTIFDVACTAAGLRLGVITEGNPILTGVMANSPELAAAGLCIVVGAVLLWLYSVRKKIRWLIPALAAIATIKLAVVGMHLFWIATII